MHPSSRATNPSSETDTAGSVAAAARRSSGHPVAEVGHAGSVHNARELELDGIRTEVLEEPAPLAEQHRDKVDLQLVEHPRAKA